MRKTLLTSATLLLAAAGTAAAQEGTNTATQTVSIEVQAISEISVAGSPSLVINAATAGSAPTSVVAHGTYAVTTNETNRKITAAIDGLGMPSGVTLTAALAAPTGASSAGAVMLGAVAQDVVTGISTVSESGLDITYQLSATVEAGAVAATSKTVTYTITAGA